MNPNPRNVLGPLTTLTGWDRLGAILTRDLGRRFDRCVTWVRNPLAVLIAAAVVATLCGFCLHPQGFVVAIGLAGLITVGVVWPWINLWGVRGTISFDRSRASEGEPVLVRLTLRNVAPWTAWGLAIEAGSGAMADAGLADLGGRRQVEVTWSFLPDCRGVYPTQSPRITTGFPFGLWEAARGLTAANSLVVWPRTVAVGPVPSTGGGQTTEGHSPRNRPGGSGDFLGVRPYRRGDSLRRVHWPQTARSGQMVICELQSHAVPRVQVVLDTNPAAHAGTGPDCSLEWAIRIAASFVSAWLADGAEVDLILANGPTTPPGRSLSSRRTTALDALAKIDPAGAAISLIDLLDLPACRRFVGGLRVVITTDRAPTRLGDRSRGVAQGSERFVVLKASGFDPDAISAPVEPLALSPWIWIDEPDQVPRQLRRPRKEVILAP